MAFSTRCINVAESVDVHQEVLRTQAAFPFKSKKVLLVAIINQSIANSSFPAIPIYNSYGHTYSKMALLSMGRLDNCILR